MPTTTTTPRRENYAGKRVVITGGLGFIGSNLAHALVAAGARVTIIDALLPAYGGNRVNLAGIEEAVALIDGNILDADLIERAVTGADVVFHLAGQVGYVDAKDKPFVDLDYNGRGTLILLEALRQSAPQARLLFASSRLVYGPITAIPVREDHPTNPLSLYGIHKLLGEKYIGYYAHEFGIHGVSVRIPNPYGPRQQMKHSKYSIVGWFIRQALDNQTITVFGDGSQERDYVYIDDIVEALLRLPLSGKAGEAYNIGSRERVRFVDMVDTIIRVAGSGRKEHVPWPADYEKNETGDYTADTSKITAATQWEPQVGLTEGIRKTVEYYQKNREYYW
ncbi:MAG TPA: NAD-dependent epimerase/dehydratase family protein [Candidatus Andersenbacteria bacterium]|nr:NAD-dependent epimerase/dehydratase family protein [Candidatus Andersenbacteria bacterium]